MMWVVSAVSAYEIGYKNRIGKLEEAETLLGSFTATVEEQPFGLFDLTADHALAAGALPLIHRDPFDRLLIAQAQVEGAVLVSNEKLFDRYGVRRLW